MEQSENIIQDLKPDCLGQITCKLLILQKKVDDRFQEMNDGIKMCLVCKEKVVHKIGVFHKHVWVLW